MNERLRLINENLLHILGTKEYVTRWWTTSNFHFKLRCPQELWDSGARGQEEVEEYVNHNVESAYRNQP